MKIINLFYWWYSVICDGLASHWVSVASAFRHAIATIDVITNDCWNKSVQWLLWSFCLKDCSNHCDEKYNYQDAVCHCLIRSAIPGIFLFYSDHGSYMEPGSDKDCPTFCRRIKTIAVMVEIMVLITILWDPVFTLVSDDTNKPPVPSDLRHWKR